MNRQRLHLAVDITMFICGLGVIATGLLIYFVLPPGSHGDTVWSLTRHDWGDWHFYIALALLATVMLHLLLNWNWVCNVVCKMVGVKPGRGGWGRKLAGALALAIIVGLVGGFVLLAGQAKQIGQPGDGEGRHRADHRRTMEQVPQELREWRRELQLLGLDPDELLPIEPLDDRPPVRE